MECRYVHDTKDNGYILNASGEPIEQEENEIQVYVRMLEGC